MTWKYRRDCFNAREGVGFISRKIRRRVTMRGGCSATLESANFSSWRWKFASY